MVLKNIFAERRISYEAVSKVALSAPYHSISKLLLFFNTLQFRG
jgi:hypothetical protein